MTTERTVPAWTRPTLPQVQTKARKEMAIALALI